jgi:hypothetical protein
MKLEFKNTDTKVTCENYPYGFKMKTTKTDWLEFSPKKGFRHCSQTIDPKTGRLNNPKKSTYYTVGILGIDENQHTKFWACGFNGEKEMKISYKHLYFEFDKYTGPQMEYLYIEAMLYLKVHCKAMIMYTGADWDNVRPLIDVAVKTLVQAINCKGTLNLWGDILDSIDFEALEATKKPHYSPFQVKQVSI